MKGSVAQTAFVAFTVLFSIGTIFFFFGCLCVCIPHFVVMSPKIFCYHKYIIAASTIALQLAVFMPQSHEQILLIPQSF
jgi:hypothetical protein